MFSKFWTKDYIVTNNHSARIDIGFVIKVADFGLSESMDITKDYFRQLKDSTVKLPVKWLALEGINDGIFSEKSDVVCSQL